ncbi:MULTISPECIES: UvrD-helicase domain-containing protein [Myroides]|uniref:UvrD-helicase domain-containing protein n=1 Tax=Myroides TaxID=76831 RepID=UPI0025751023|nr:MULTISPECIES: UvrD-helicase domain-containing protein [Myroides]MDM1353248.1 ATP-dependent helicase [Myroides marinus]MDM1461165.1 ATP-dependent helicase [Myroides odoratimimus]
MTQVENMSPAEKASIDCIEKVFASLTANKNFLVEAGAGAGKTYTLIKALKHQIENNSDRFLRSNKKIACITYTNVAKEEIQSRTDNNPIVFAETIHAFGWHVIKDFQKAIREQIPNLTDRWKERIEEAGGITQQTVIYNLGYPKITADEIFLHHDDVIKLLTYLLDDKKFQKILTNKFPVIFIDEYQDTNINLANAIVKNFIETEEGPLIGFFGDHWQKIYGSNSCGLITATEGKIEVIGKQANFRSDKLIVKALNKIRPELEQHESNPNSTGEILIYHSNNYTGERRTGNHWKDDLPEKVAHNYLSKTIAELEAKGWNIAADTTKVLMLTNSVLASEQNYQNIFQVFSDTDDYLKKNDDYISFLSDVVEPGSVAFHNRKYGEMLNAFNMNAPRIRKHADKEAWHSDMTRLIEARNNGTIGNVVDLLKETKRPRISKKIEEKEKRLLEINQKTIEQQKEEEIAFAEKIKNIRSIPYSELINVVQYIDDKTLFSTKHGVKGAEFENVLVVFGRGWNNYNWNQMLEWATNGTPNGKQDSFERNRNLFYVACSRPKKRLTLLFTQELSVTAITTLQNWFGNVVEPLII